MESIVNEWYEDKNNVDEMIHWKNRQLKVWEQNVVDYFPQRAKILDIGCGLGREAFALADMGFTIIGIDISERIIEQVTELSLKNNYSISFLLYDGHKLPFEDDTYDAIIIWSQTFGLLYGDKYKNDFINECKRVLKKDGLLSFSSHDYKYVKEYYEQYTIDNKFFPYANAEIYWEMFNVDELIKYAENANMTTVLCEQGSIYKPEDGTILHCLCRK